MAEKLNPGYSSSKIEDVWRQHSAAVLAALLRRHRELPDCEDAAQEALRAAIEQWRVDGIPRNPQGWLVRVASRRLVDQQRRDVARQRREALVTFRPETNESDSWQESTSDSDDSLKLLFLCAHVSLPLESAVALTLRAVIGLTTQQISSCLFVSTDTLRRRITRAKTTLQKQGVKFEQFPKHELPKRLNTVCHVLHLIFTTGSTDIYGAGLVNETLVNEALRLARRLHQALPTDLEVAGLLALMLLVSARHPGRINAEGQIVPLSAQNRNLWDQESIRKGTELLDKTLPKGQVGTFQVQAAIAALHSNSPSSQETDWPQILELYRILKQLSPGPAVQVASAIASAEVFGPRHGLREIDTLLKKHPRDYRALAAKGHFLLDLGLPGADTVFQSAADLTPSTQEKTYLLSRINGALNPENDL